MKKIKTLKREIILENGYGKPGEQLSQNNFNLLSDEEKKKCTKVDNWWYKTPEIIPDLTNEEVMLIMEEANYKNIKIMKYCLLFFTALTAIFLFIALIAIGNLYC